MSSQAVTQTPCARVARFLRRGETCELPFACLEELLVWVGGGRHESTEAFYGILGQAGDDLKLLRRAYVLLDRALFVGGRLFTPAIELDSAPSRETIQQRYRRLVIAFHPDRYSALSEWLTPRSQAVNAAYSAWKENRTQLEDVESAGAPEGPAWAAYSSSDKQPVTDWRLEWRRIVLWLRYNLSQVEHLPHKIIAATFLLCLVPLFYLYRADESYLELSAKRTSSSAIRPSERKAEQDSDELVPDMLRPLWPLLAGGSADRVAAFGAEKVATQPAPSVAVTASQVSSKTPALGGVRPAFGTMAHGEALSSSARAIPRARPSQDAHAVQAAAAQKTRPEAGTATGARNLIAPRSDAAHRQDMVTPSISRKPTARPEPVAVVLPHLPAVSASMSALAVKPSPPASSSAASRLDSTPPAPVKASDALAPVPFASSPSHRAGPALAVAAPTAVLAPLGSDERHIHQFNADIDAVTRLLESYRGSFQRGDLETFLSHFSSNASENDHVGTAWLHLTYQKLFSETLSRSLSLNVGTISMEGQNARVRAEYRLALVYADQRSAAASGHVDYTLQRADNGWKIARISYKAGGG